LVQDTAEDSTVVKGKAGLVVDPETGLFGEQPTGRYEYCWQMVCGKRIFTDQLRCLASQPVLSGWGFSLLDELVKDDQYLMALGNQVH
jgi:hypothetical protein